MDELRDANRERVKTLEAQMETIEAQMQRLIQNMDWHATESHGHGITYEEDEKLYNTWATGNKEDLAAIKIVYTDFKYQTRANFIGKYYEYLEKAGKLLNNELALRFLETSDEWEELSCTLYDMRDANRERISGKSRPEATSRPEFKPEDKPSHVMIKETLENSAEDITGKFSEKEINCQAKSEEEELKGKALITLENSQNQEDYPAIKEEVIHDEKKIDETKVVYKTEIIEEIEVMQEITSRLTEQEEKAFPEKEETILSNQERKEVNIIVEKKSNKESKRKSIPTKSHCRRH